MNQVEGRSPKRPVTAEPTILPCNFRSAGRLSNESARTLTTLHEVFARNLTNSLDVYLGTGLEVRLISLEQLAMDEFRAICTNASYMLPCHVLQSASTVLIELDSVIMFTIIDLLLGGSGSDPEGSRELTDIDEDILEDVSRLIASQIERIWKPLGFTEVTPGKNVKPSLAHRAFPPTEKVLRVRFDVNVAGMTGALFVAFQASLGSHLVRNIRADSNASPDGKSYAAVPELKQRILDCEFALSGELPDLKVSVRELTRIEPGSVLKLTAAAGAPGRLMLEGRGFFDAVAVGQGNNKAMQLVAALHTPDSGLKGVKELGNGQY